MSAKSTASRQVAEAALAVHAAAAINGHFVDISDFYSKAG